MRLIKMSCAVAVAAIAVTALIGAGTAYAENSKLCSETEKEEVCIGEKEGYTGEITGELETGEAANPAEFKIEAQKFTIKCNESSFKGKIEVNPGIVATHGQVAGQIETATWKKCSEGGCTEVKALQTPWTLHIEQGMEPNKGLVFLGPSDINEEKQPGFEIVCAGKPYNGCVFKANETQPLYKEHKWAKLRIEGSSMGKPGKIWAESVELKGVGLCGNAFWTQHYTVTKPAMFFLI